VSAADLLPLGWAALVAAALWRRRPSRVRPLAAGRTGPRSAAIVVAPLGARLRRVVGLPPDALADVVVGATAVATLGALVLLAPLVPLVVVLGAAALPAGRRRRARLASAGWVDALPDAVDLFGIALGSGLTVPAALSVVAPRAPPPLGPALAEAELRFRHGEPLDRALVRIADGAPAVGPLLRVLVAAHRDGAPVAEALVRLGDEQRSARRRAAEARARRVPVRMLFPLVGCTLPAFVLVTVVPPVASALAELRL
jgi:Flp pilus assembly protein TadB